MPYTLNSFLLDLGGWFASAFPAMNGRFFAPPPASGSNPVPLDSASNNPSSPSQAMTLTFASTAVPPASGTFSLHVVDTSTGGDLYRSGVISSLPPSPGLLSIITAQTETITTAELNGIIARFTPTTLTIPTGIAVAAGILTLGTLIPLEASMTAITPVTGGAPLTFTVSGTITSQRFWFFRVTTTFIYTFTLSITPSGDSANQERVVAVRTPASTLGGNTLNPLFNTLLGPLLGVFLSGFTENLINAQILGLARSVLNEQGFRMSPSATLSARRITITSAGLAVQLAVSDAHGPGVLALPGSLRVTIAPAPSTAVNVSYTITVLNSASGLPVAGAAVSIRNFNATGLVQTLSAVTDAAGVATITATLNARITFGIRIENGARVRVRFFTPPVLLVTAAGFRNAEIPLLEDMDLL